MSDERSYWTAICADLNHDRPRLAYADWLTSRGDSRGEFIRVQCEQAGLYRPFAWNRNTRWTLPIPRSGEAYDRFYDLSQLREQLINDHLNEWTKPLADLGCVAFPGTFERGLVERIRIDPQLFPQLSEELFRLAPALRRLQTRGPVPQAVFERLIGSAGMKRIITVEMRKAGLDARAAEAIVHQGNVEGLEELLLDGNPIGDPGAVLLASSPKLGKLRRLGLANCKIGDVGFAALASSPHLRQLVELDVSANTIDDLAPACSSAIGPRLMVLNLAENRLEEESLRLFLRSPQLRGLRTLDVSHSSFIIGASFLQGCAFREALRELYLDGLDMGTDDGQSLGALDFPALELLKLRNNSIGEAGFAALVNSAVMARLCTLEVASNELNDEAVASLARAPHIGRLWCLSLGENEIGDEGARLLAQAPWIGRVRELVLARNQIGPAGMAALAESLELSPSSLLLDRNRLGNEGAGALASAAWISRIRSLSVDENNIDDEALRQLAQAPKLRPGVRQSLLEELEQSRT